MVDEEPLSGPSGGAPAGWIPPSLLDIRVQSILGGLLGGIILAFSNGLAATFLAIQAGILRLLEGVRSFRDELLRLLTDVPASAIVGAFEAARDNLGEFGLLAFVVAIGVVIGTLWLVSKEVQILG